MSSSRAQRRAFMFPSAEPLFRTSFLAEFCGWHARTSRVCVPASFSAATSEFSHERKQEPRVPIGPLPGPPPLPCPLTCVSENTSPPFPVWPHRAWRVQPAARFRFLEAPRGLLCTCRGFVDARHWTPVHVVEYFARTAGGFNAFFLSHLTPVLVPFSLAPFASSYDFSLFAPLLRMNFSRQLHRPSISVL